MNLITGRAGTAHITPRQDAMWHQGLTETESCIFDAYENFAAEIITNNEVRIRSGVGMLQGRFFCIEPNTYDSAEIANGNQGEERIDLIVARITVDPSANTQSASIEVIQGTPAAENPLAPEATTGNLDAGDLIADYPLAQVLLNGINIVSVTPVFDAGWLFNGAGRQKLNFIGINPIASPDEDTPENWIALGTGVAIFTENRLNNQPYNNLLVENIVTETAVVQIATSLRGYSEMWIRSGNSANWYGGTTGWVKIINANSIEYGFIGSQSIAAQSYRDVAIAFTKNFSKPPTVILTLGSTSTSPDLGSISVALVTFPTTTGFNARIFNDSSASRSPTAHWVAIEYN